MRLAAPAKKQLGPSPVLQQFIPGGVEQRFVDAALRDLPQHLKKHPQIVAVVLDGGIDGIDQGQHQRQMIDLIIPRVLTQPGDLS